MVFKNAFKISIWIETKNLMCPLYSKLYNTVTYLLIWVETYSANVSIVIPPLELDRW